MKQAFVYLTVALIAIRCGGESPVSEESNADSVYSDDHEWIVGAKELKEKLGTLQQDFTVIAHKELEESVCPEGATVPYRGDSEQMDVSLMMNYLLDNFDPENFGQFGFDIPADKKKRDVPLTELNWINFNTLSSGPDFSLFQDFPDLKNVPREVPDSNGQMVPYEKPLQDAEEVLRLFKNGLVCVVAVVDYLAPTFVSKDNFEGGYLTGYILVADWETAKLSCMVPLLAENQPFDFSDFNEKVEAGIKPLELQAMEADIQNQTFDAIREIVRKMTGFGGKIRVNDWTNG